MRCGRAMSFFVLVLFAAVSAPASAHDFTPGVLTIVERGEDVYRYRFTPPVDDGISLGTRLRFPELCEELEPGIVRCPGGLAGAVSFGRGMDRRTQVLVFFERLDGRIEETRVAGARPVWDVAEPPSGASAWIATGAEHVLLGFDHLAFVLGLLLVIGATPAGRRPRLARAAAAITAFTVAHSLTLALATFGVVRLPAAPVEATIALSVLLLAVEASHTRSTSTRRAPWLVAFLFGLVHGLGFASALAEIGLPPASRVPALFEFNVGVELAQLSVVAASLLLAECIPRPWRIHGRRALCYALGAASAYWSIGRLCALGS